MVTMILLLSPAIFYYDSPQVAAQLNATGWGAASGFTSNIFTPLNSTAFGGTNHTSGFFAQVTVFTGLAFVFDQFGNIMLTLLNLPKIMIYLISTPLSILGFPIATTSVLVSLFFGLLMFILVIEGISAWQKYQIRGQG
jgi:hypothetical protein